MIRKLGCIHDAPHVKGNATKEALFSARNKSYSAANPPDKWIYPCLENIKIRDQGDAPTCVGFGCSQAMQAVAQFHFPYQDFPIPSALDLYTKALVLTDRIGTDTGTTIGACLEAAETYGFVPETQVSYEPSRRFDTLDLDELILGLPQVGLRAHRLQETGIARRLPIKRALMSGKGVVGGVDVDEPFTQDKGPSVWCGPSSTIIGGHAMCLLDYPVGLPRWVGSYGEGWRDSGLLTTSWEVVELARSIWIIDFTPSYLQGVLYGWL